MKIRNIYNAALLIETQKAKILVDGIIEDENFFYVPKEAFEQKVLDASDECEGLTGLFFTHCHEDHFSGEKVGKIIEKNPNLNLCLPYDEGEMFCKRLKQLGNSASVMMLEIGKGEFFYHDLKISYFCSGHVSSDKVGGHRHYCYCFEDGKEKVIVTADFDTENIDEVLKWAGEGVTRVYANPLILGNDRIVDRLEKWKDVEICIYHIPEEEKDQMMYRRLAFANAQKYSDKIKNINLCV